MLSVGRRSIGWVSGLAIDLFRRAEALNPGALLRWVRGHWFKSSRAHKVFSWSPPSAGCLVGCLVA